MRNLANKIRETMEDKGMKVRGDDFVLVSFAAENIGLLGLVTDGEFNSLRSQGNERPTNIIQIRANVRNDVKKIGLEKLRRYFMPQRECNEVISDF